MNGSASARSGEGQRTVSVDALRGLVMFMMIFVNDLAGAPERIVPPWMRHFHGKSGMTFVDLVFPAFLFIVGMSIPLALSRRATNLGIIGHILVRTLSLLAIGIMMVNDESPDSAELGWSSTWWTVLFYGSTILAFCSIKKSRNGEEGKSSKRRFVSLVLRGLGMAGLIFLALSFRGKNGQRIVTFSPFSIHTEWYGILGLIGWAYLVGSIVYLVFRGHRTAILGTLVLLMCLYPAERTGAFNGFWLGRYVGLGGTIGSQGAITVAGVLIGSMLVAPEMAGVWERFRFTLLFIAGFAAAALLVHGLYGIYKNSATPSWCLWSCAITAGLWLLFYVICDVRPIPTIARLLALAGSNVLLAYLLSEMFPSALELAALGDWYGKIGELGLGFAIGRSVICAVVILAVGAGLNRAGFRLKL